MKQRTLAATVLVALLFVLTLGASRASATITTETFYFTSCHLSNGCPLAAPYGSVVLTQNGTSVDVSVTLFNGIQFIKTGAGDDQAFKFIGATGKNSAYGGTIQVSDITITGPSSPGLIVNGPLGNGGDNWDGDGTGYFSFGISCPLCKNGGAGAFAGPIDFTVINATIPQLTVANSPQGFTFVADVIFPGGNGQFTGPIDASTGIVPDGGMTLMLLGGALVGLGALRTKFRV